MDLRFSPLRTVGVVAIGPAGSSSALPRWVRVVDAEVAATVRRLALDEPGSPPHEDGDAASRVDALIVMAENGKDQGWHECGGA